MAKRAKSRNAKDAVARFIELREAAAMIRADSRSLRARTREAIGISKALRRLRRAG